jgi:hypothetical protein
MAHRLAGPFICRQRVASGLKANGDDYSDAMQTSTESGCVFLRSFLPTTVPKDDTAHNMSRVNEVLVAPAAPRISSKVPRLSLSDVWLVTAVLLPVVAALEASLSSVDLAYHIRAGNDMLNTHSLIRTDTYTFTASGRSWVDPQWLSQLLFALVHRAGGWAGLHVLRAALVGAIFLFVVLACRARGVSRRSAAALTIGAFVVSVGGLGLRPQLIGMLFFAMTTFLVFQRDQHPLALWLVPAIVAVWANTHGSFFLGPLIVLLIYLDDVRRRSATRNRVLAVLLASLAAVALNPFGLRVWSYAASLSTNPVITRFVTEWQPPEVRDVVGAIFYVSAFGVVAFLARRSAPTPWTTLTLLGVFFVIGIIAVRGVFWWALVAPVVVAELIAQDHSTPRASSIGVPAANAAIVGLLVILTISALPWWRADNPLANSPQLVTDAPPGITAELRRVLTPGDRIFNPQRWGSWFEFALPEYPVAVDSRIEVLPTSVWQAYTNVSFGREGWQRILDQWKVSVVVAHTEQQHELIPIIRRDPGWRLAYRERDGLVFVRTS